MSYSPVKPRITSYVDCALLWPRTRNKAEGKPVGTFRLFHEKDNNSFRLDHWGVPAFRIYADNTIEVLFDRPPAVIERVVPLFEARVSYGRYRIDHHLNTPTNRYGWPDSVHMTKVAPELFKGIKFNLANGECVNRRPDLKTTEDPELRKMWRKDMQTFVKNMIVRARLGAFDKYLAETTHPGYYSQIVNDDSLRMVAEAIRSQESSEELMSMIARLAVYRHRYHYGKSMGTPAATVENVLQSLIDSRRTTLKKWYGVYKEPDPS